MDIENDLIDMFTLGDLKEIKKYYEKNEKEIDINFFDDYLFRYSCSAGYYDIVRWLLLNFDNINIRVFDDYGFCSSYTNGHYKISLLLSIFVDEYEIVFDNDKVVNAYIKEFMKKIDIETCCICMEKQSDALTFCNHQACSDCLRKWLDISDTCPICRKEDLWIKIIIQI